MKSFEALREEFPTFSYDSYEILQKSDCTEVVFHFSINNLSTFSPKWSFPACGKLVETDAHLRNLVFNLGMAELVSYWKMTCSPNVIIKAGSLTDNQISWWKKLYFHGLGEFFYLNNINADENFMSISSVGEEISINQSDRELKGNLVPVGGGKDSSVTLELLRSMKEENHPYIINPRGATLESAAVSGCSERNITVSRSLDRNMLHLNSEGYLNGHTPFSAIVAFSSVLCAYIKSLKYVILSNESSANESTVAGSSVNHQYSKSFEFESDFQYYEKTYLKSGVFYFSLLRPLSEYQIARYFAKITQYHAVFRSCNRGSKKNEWCANCPKCLFVWFILSPFLSFEELEKIFGRNMANDESLIPTMEQLIGIASEKPFECVGSRSEVNFAICDAIAKNDTLPLLYEKYKQYPLYEKYSSAENPYPSYYDENNALPEKFSEIVKREAL